MERPRILISGQQGRTANYERAVQLAGGTPIPRYCPPTELVCDGLILAGGGDMAPFLFGEEDEGSREIDIERDRAELALIQKFLALGKPVLGICRGHQVLNLALGGILIQDLDIDLAVFHSPDVSGSSSDLPHPVAIKKGSCLAELYGSIAVVNSNHHQALYKSGKGMIETAWTESGLNEATEHETLPVLTVQFHPERMDGGDRIFDWLMEECRRWRA